MPGNGANGLTVWMPPAIYAPKDTKHPEEVEEVPRVRRERCGL